MKIPLIEANEPLATPQPRLRGADEGNIIDRALFNLGSQGLGLATEILTQKRELNEKLKEQEDQDKLAQMSKDFQLFASNLSKETRTGENYNPDTHFARYTMAMDKQAKEMLAQIKDPKLLSRASKMLTTLSIEPLINEENFQTTKRVDRIVGNAEKQILDLANAGDVEGAKRVSSEMVDGGWATPSWKVKSDDKVESIVENAEVMRRLYTNPTVEKLEELKADLRSGKYRTVNPKERETLIKTIGDEQDKLKKELEQKSDREKSLELVADVSKMFSDVKDRPETYHSARLQKLLDPEYLKEKGASLAQGRAAIEFIENEERRLDRNYQKKFEPTQQKFLEKLQAGTLTESEVLKSDLPAIDGRIQGDKAWFLSQIRARKAELLKQEDDIYLHPNPKIYSDVLTGVLTDTKNWNKQKIFSYVAKRDRDGKNVGITANNAFSILKIYDDLIKPNDEVLAKKYLPLQQAAGRLQTYRDLGFFVIPKEKDSRGNPVYSPQEKLNNDLIHAAVLKELGARVEKGEDASVVVDELMKPYVMQEARKGWLERTQEAWMEMTWGKIFPSKPPKSGPADQYVVGQIYQDAKGRKARYSGNGEGIIIEGPDKGKLLRFTD